MGTDKSGNLGKIDKPAADLYAGVRKVYMVRIIHQIPNVPEEYQRLAQEYWQSVDEQLTAMETKAGLIKHIFIENIPGRGEDVKVILERNFSAIRELCQPRVERGAKFELLEDQDLLFECIDWESCLSIQLTSAQVVQQIQARYQEVAKKRIAFQLDAIDKAIPEAGCALLLFSSPEPAIPDGIERFIISPPAFDKLQRWVQQYTEQILSRRNQQAAGDSTDGDKPSEDKGSGVSSGGIWTP